MPLSEILPFWIGRSRILDAKRAECEKCAQVVEERIKQISGSWTREDNFGPTRTERMAVVSQLQEVARRIRKRNEERVGR